MEFARRRRRPACGVGVEGRKANTQSPYHLIPNVGVWTHEGRKVRFDVMV